MATATPTRKTTTSPERAGTPGITRSPADGGALVAGAEAASVPAVMGGPMRTGTPRRPVPLLFWAALGAMAAAGYAWLGLGMGFGPPLVMTALGGLTLVLGAGALWRVVDPLTRTGEGRLPTDVRAPHRIRELEREKQIVLKAIKEIELDYQMRKISEPDYREMIERYRARALRVMGDLAAGDNYRVLIERELKGRLSAAAQAGAMESRAAGKAEDKADEKAEERPGGTESKIHGSATVAAAAPPTSPEMIPGTVEAQVLLDLSSFDPTLPAPSDGAGGTTSPPPDGPGTEERTEDRPERCGACATLNDRDARFCKRCGKNLFVLAPPSVPA